MRSKRAGRYLKFQTNHPLASNKAFEPSPPVHSGKACHVFVGNDSTVLIKDRESSARTCVPRANEVPDVMLGNFR